MPDTESKVGLHIRLAAILYDSILLLAVLFVATIPVTLLHGGATHGELWYRLYLLLVVFVFFAWFWTHGGQTLGMRAWRVQLQANDGGPVSGRACAIRYGVALLSWTAFGLGFLWSLWDPQARTWHDLASSTRLVRLPRRRLDDTATGAG